MCRCFEGDEEHLMMCGVDFFNPTSKLKRFSIIKIFHQFGIITAYMVGNKLLINPIIQHLCRKGILVLSQSRYFSNGQIISTRFIQGYFVLIEELLFDRYLTNRYIWIIRICRIDFD